MSKLSQAMESAIRNAHEDGTLSDTSRATETALIRRGLAVALYGTVTRRNRYSNLAQTEYNAYLGARLVKAVA